MIHNYDPEGKYHLDTIVNTYDPFNLKMSSYKGRTIILTEEVLYKYQVKDNRWTFLQLLVLGIPFHKGYLVNNWGDYLFNREVSLQRFSLFVFLSQLHNKENKFNKCRYKSEIYNGIETLNLIRETK